jgi:hypothetical protein
MLTCPGADSNLLSIKVSHISDFCKEYKKVFRRKMCGVVAGGGVFAKLSSGVSGEHGWPPGDPSTCDKYCTV